MDILKKITLLMTCFLLFGCQLNTSEADKTIDINAPPLPGELAKKEALGEETGLPDKETASLETETGLPEKDLEPVSGGTLSLAMLQPTTLNPLLNSEKTVDYILSFLFEPLLYISDELLPTVNPRLTKSFDFSADGLSMIIQLRDDVFWSDNTPVQADDFIYSIEVLQKAPDNVIYKEVVHNILSVNQIDLSTVRITFIEPAAKSAFLFTFPLIPKHYYADNDQAPWLPMGNSFFVMEEYKPPFHLKLKGENTYITDINIMIARDTDTAHYAFQQGKIDALVTTLYKWGQFKQMKQNEYHAYDTPIFDCLAFNFERELFQSPENRQAMAYLLPMEELVKQVYLNYADASLTPIHPHAWFYTAPSPYEFNLEKADSLLPDDFDCQIIVNAESGSKIAIANILQKNIQLVGRKATVEILPFEQYEERVREKSFDIALVSANLDFSGDLRGLLHSQENLFGYESAEMDKLILEAAQASDKNKLQAAMAALQIHLAQELPVIGIAFQQGVLLTDLDMKGLIMPMADKPFFTISEWFISEAN